MCCETSAKKSPFQIGSNNLPPSVVNNVESGPNSSPISISGNIAGSFNFQPTHCAVIPNMMIPANSNINFLLNFYKNTKERLIFLK